MTTINPTLASQGEWGAGLIELASRVDTLLDKECDRKWADSFTSQIIDALTIDDEELIDCAFPEGYEGDEDDEEDTEPDVDYLREMRVDNIIDDMICELPDGYTIDRTDAYQYTILKDGVEE